MSIPALERDNPLDLFDRQHVMEVKPTFQDVTAGHEDQMAQVSKSMLTCPDTLWPDQHELPVPRP